MTTDHMAFLAEVSQDDLSALIKAEASYGSSWKRRGGVGAFMMLARKWDRIEKQVDQVLAQPLPVQRFDILGHIMADPRPEGILDDIQDLRRYLMLVEAEVRARRANHAG